MGSKTTSHCWNVSSVGNLNTNRSSGPVFGQDEVVGKPPGGASMGNAVMLQSWHCSPSHSSSPSAPGKCHFTLQHQPACVRSPRPAGCESDWRWSLPGPHSTSLSSRQGKQQGWASLSLCLAPAIGGNVALGCQCPSQPGNELCHGGSAANIIFQWFTGFPSLKAHELVLEAWEKRRTGCCEKCFIPIEKKHDSYSKMKSQRNFFTGSCSVTPAYHL